MTTTTMFSRRALRSPTYLRLASAPRGTGARPVRRASVVPTRASLLQRALRSLGWPR